MAGKKTREYVRDMQEVKSLEAEVLDLEIGLEQGFVRLKGYQSDVLKDARKYLDTMKQNRQYSESNKKQWQETANAVKDSLNFNMSQEQIQQKITQLKRKEKMGVNTQAAQGVAKKQLGTKKQADMMGKMAKSLSGVASQLGMLVKVGGPLMMMGTLIQFLIDLFMSYDKKIQNTYETFGAVGGRMNEVLAIQNDIDKSMMKIGKRFQDAQNAGAEFAKTMAVTTIEAHEIGASIVDMAKATANSEQNISKLSRTMQLARGASQEMSFDFQRIAFAMALLENDIAVPGAIIEDMANNSELMYSMVGSTSKEMARSAVNAAKLNTNLGTFEKIGKNMLDVQKMINQENSLRLMNMNVQGSLELGSLFNQGRMLDFQIGILQQLRGITNLNELDVLQQEQLTEFYGVEYSILRDMVASTADIVDLNSMNEEQLKRVEEQAKKIQGVKAQSPMQQMLNIIRAELMPMIERKMIPAFEKIMGIMQKISGFFESISDWLAWLNPFNDTYYKDKAIAEEKTRREDIKLFGTEAEKRRLAETIEMESRNIAAGIPPEYLKDAIDSDASRAFWYTGPGPIWDMDFSTINKETSSWKGLVDDSGISKTDTQFQKDVITDIFSVENRRDMTVEDVMDAIFGDGGLDFYERDMLTQANLMGNNEMIRNIREAVGLGVVEGTKQVNDENKHNPNSSIGTTSISRESIETSLGVDRGSIF